MLQSRFLILSHQSSCFWVGIISQRSICFHVIIKSRSFVSLSLCTFVNEKSAATFRVGKNPQNTQTLILMLYFYLYFTQTHAYKGAIALTILKAVAG